MAEKKINGKQYACDPLPAIEALALYADLMRVASRATGRVALLLATIIEKEETDDHLEIELAAMAALNDVLEKTPTSQITDLVERLLATVQVKNSDGFDDVIPEIEFRDNMKSLVAVCAFAVETQFSDFFTGKKGSGAVAIVTRYLAKRK